MSGIVLEPDVAHAITRWVCWESVCEAGKLAALMATGKRPLGSFAS